MKNTITKKKSEARMTVFLSLPVSLARRILDSGQFEDPTAAILSALYTGDYLAEGPDPRAELKAAFARVQQRLSTRDWLNAVCTNSANPTPPTVNNQKQN
jgi:hypothetical protein